MKKYRIIRNNEKNIFHVEYRAWFTLFIWCSYKELSHWDGTYQTLYFDDYSWALDCLNQVRNKQRKNKTNYAVMYEV